MVVRVKGQRLINITAPEAACLVGQLVVNRRGHWVRGQMSNTGRGQSLVRGVFLGGSEVKGQYRRSEVRSMFFFYL